MQALFGLDHVAGGEAIFAASVLTQFDQTGRIAHRAHDLVELVDAVAVPMREHRHVPAREGRLLVCDRVQRNGRVGYDPRAVVTGDLAVKVRPVGSFNAVALDALCGCADLALRLKPDALSFKAAMVDPGVDVEFGQPLVDVFGPAFPPALDHLRAVPFPHLRAETVLGHAAHGEHDMGMGLRHPVLANVPMQIEISDHAPIDEFGLREVAGKHDALRLRHLARNGELDFAGKLCVFTHLECFHIVPKPFAVAPRLGGVLGQQHLGMADAALVGKILNAVDTLIARPRRRAVGGGGHRARPGLAANDLDVKMIDRHRDQALPRSSARRNDV